MFMFDTSKFNLTSLFEMYDIKFGGQNCFNPQMPEVLSNFKSNMRIMSNSLCKRILLETKLFIKDWCTNLYG